MSKKSLHGFTLVELSIVLLIIGMITTGIIGGRELLRQSELQSVISDVEKYKTAINTFEMAYNALPGDFDEASEYWPVECVDSGTYLCNGNGDWTIGASGTREDLRAWQHLSLAEIIQGGYTGIPQVSGNPEQISVNIPPSRISGVGYWMYTAASGMYGVGEGVIIKTASETSTGMYGGAHTPKDLRTIDLKLDDGEPDSGRVLAEPGYDGAAYYTTCLTAPYNVTPTEYLLATKDRVCRLRYTIRE